MLVRNLYHVFSTTPSHCVRGYSSLANEFNHNPGCPSGPAPQGPMPGKDPRHDAEDTSPPRSPVQAEKRSISFSGIIDGPSPSKRSISFSFDTDGEPSDDGPGATPSAIRRRRPPPIDSSLQSPTSPFGSCCHTRMFAMRAIRFARSPALRTQSASRRTADDTRGCAAQNRKSAPPCRFDRQWGGPDTRRFRKCLLLTIRRWQQRIIGMPSRQYKCGQCRLGAPGIPLTVALVCSQIACAAHNDTAIPRYAAADSQPQENRRHR
jgi:hypothetical protein